MYACCLHYLYALFFCSPPRISIFFPTFVLPQPLFFSLLLESLNCKIDTFSQHLFFWCSDQLGGKNHLFIPLAAHQGLLLCSCLATAAEAIAGCRSVFGVCVRSRERERGSMLSEQAEAGTDAGHPHVSSVAASLCLAHSGAAHTLEFYIRDTRTHTRSPSVSLSLAAVSHVRYV